MAIKKDLPLVSVIVAAYNAEKYIGDLLDSLHNQDYSNIEIIVVNDGSTDFTLDVIEKKKRVDSRIKVITQANAGVSAARNVGFENSCGDYVIFIDADDLVERSMITVLVKNAEANNADISICNISEWNNIKESNARDLKLVNTVKCLSSEEALKNLFLGRLVRSGMWNKLLKRDVANGLKFEEGRRVNEDKYYCFQALKKSKKIVYTDAKLYCYMYREDSVTRKNFDSRWFDMLYFADSMYAQMCESELELYARYSKIAAYYFLINHLIKNGKVFEYHQEYIKIVDELRKIKINDLKEYFPASTVISIYMLKISEALFLYTARFRKVR